MKYSMYLATGAIAVGALAWLAVPHGQASADHDEPAAHPAGETDTPVGHFPRGSTQSRYKAIHVVVPSTKSYGPLLADFESIVHRADFDILGNLTPEEMDRKLRDIPDKDGLMILAQSELGKRQTLLVGHPVRAKHYLVGNPLVASRMIGRHTAAGLYVPLRVLIYEDERGHAVIAYDQPSSLLGQFHDEKVLEVARMLDRKLGAIATRAAH